MLINFFFSQGTILHSLRHRLICIIISTLHICTSQHALGSRISGIARNFMAGPEISNSATVGNYQVLESPLIPENLLQKAGVAAAWFIIPTLIGTHHLTHLGILHQSLEGRHISFPKVARCNIGNIVCMASPFWSAMNCIVLGTSPEFAVFRIFRSLQSAHHGTSHPTGKIRILTIGFLSTSPARITENIHVWSPDR